MAISKGFTDYNRRYLELRDIFEFLFPITKAGKITREFYKIINEYLDELNQKAIATNKFNFVLSKNIFGNKERIFPEHNAYNTNNELWYNIIFTMYHKTEDDSQYKNDMRPENERSYAKDKQGNDLSIWDVFNEMNDNNLTALRDGNCMFHKKDITNFLGVMDKITPFSTLGFWMYLRTKPFLPSIPIIFHGSNPRIGGLQDILFQISYLIQQEAKAYINRIGPFQFQKIIYEDISLYQEKNNPYILATCEYKSNNTIVKIYIQGDMDLKIHDTTRAIDKKMTIEKAEKKELVNIVNYNHEYVYDFYLITNRKSIKGDYLTKKVNAEGKWYGYVDGSAEKITSEYAPFIYEHFRYYGYEETKWEIIYYKFRVSEKNKIPFERWANSFGDFVYFEQRECICSDQDNYYAFFKVNDTTRVRNMEDREWDAMQELPTLLLPENAFHNLSAKQVSFLELNWLKYTLDTFPNFSKIFLCATPLKNKDDKKKIQQIKTNIDMIIKQPKNDYELYNNPFDKYQPVQDVAENHVPKMLAIIKGIYRTDQRKYYRCKKQESDNILDNMEHNAVLPYAVDFDTIKYRGADKGIFIMAFDLVQKRVIAIPFKDFTIGDSENESDGRINYSYGPYDKLYYLCSYLVKLYLQDEESAEQLKKILFEGLITENLKNIFSERAKKISDKYAKKMFKDSITPWTKYDERNNGQSQMEEDIANNGIALFTKNEIDHKKKIKNLFSYLINKDPYLINKYDKIITNNICEELIIGNASDAVIEIINEKYGTNISEQMLDIQDTIERINILNEIEYINSNLKIHELLFYLRSDACNPLNIERNIETIYDYFRNFNCAGMEVNKEVGNVTYKYLFKVQFEGFAFRKIQEIVLALTDLIEVPKEARLNSYPVPTWIQSEQKSQSKLLCYRSKEGKEFLKDAIENYFIQKKNKKGGI